MNTTSKPSMTHDQPTQCCNECGQKFGRWYITGRYRGPEPQIATYHIGVCDVCLRHDVAVTEPRDFGYLIRSWNKNIRYALGRV